MVDFRGYFQQDEGEDEREDYQRHHLGGDGGKCFHEWDFGFRAHEGEEYRGKNGDGDVGDDGECGQAWDASSKHSVITGAAVAVGQKTQMNVPWARSVLNGRREK